MDEFPQRRLLSALCHGAIFFSALIASVGIPIAVLFLNDDLIVRENAKESLNFHINVFIAAMVFGLLVFVGIGIPLLVGLWLFSLIMPIVAIVKILTNEQDVYRYPFIIRLL